MQDFTEHIQYDIYIVGEPREIRRYLIRTSVQVERKSSVKHRVGLPRLKPTMMYVVERKPRERGENKNKEQFDPRHSRREQSDCPFFVALPLQKPKIQLMPLGKSRKVRFPHARVNIATRKTDMTERTRPGIPALFTQPPPIRDPLITETIDLQNATLEKCLPFLKGIHSSQKEFNDHGVPGLQRDLHASYLYDSLEDYPEGFVAMDASRPWILYWGLAGLAMLGEETTRFRER